MGEREKFAEAVDRTQAHHAALKEADQRRAYEDEREKGRNVHELRESLREISAAYAPKVRVRFKERPASYVHQFIVDIGNTSAWLRKPYGALTIGVSGRGFSIADRFPNDLGRYVPGTGSRTSVEQVVEVIRDVAASYAARGEAAPYEPPVWVDVAVIIAGLLVGAAVWGICGLFWGWWGLIFGGVWAYFAFRLVRLCGPWVVVLLALAGGYYLARH